MSNSSKLQIFISCPPGLESILASEIQDAHIGYSSGGTTLPVQNVNFSPEDKGGIGLEGSLSTVFRANLQLRTASRVIVRLGEFYTTTFSELRSKASRFEWGEYLTPGQQVTFNVACHKSKLYHSTAVAERVLGAINDHFSKIDKKKQVYTESKTGQLILVRIVNDKCIISIDSSGEPLYKRGYKLAVAKAPLRENIASAMLLFSGWNGESPIIDPFCGSGTIPIEAAMRARHYAPGLDRQFQFFSWPCFDKKGWDSMLASSRDKIRPKTVPIFGFDRDAGAIKMAEENANRWAHDHSIEFKNQALSYLVNPGIPGSIVTNPPYGVRIKENADLRNLYSRFGTILRSSFTGWTIILLSPDDRFTANLALGVQESELSFQNGGLPVKMLKFHL